MPPSAYQIYVQEKRATLTGSVGEVAKQLSTAWSTLGQEEKTGYEDKAKELKEQYDKDLAAYKSAATGQALITANSCDLPSSCAESSHRDHPSSYGNPDFHVHHQGQHLNFSAPKGFDMSLHGASGSNPLLTQGSLQRCILEKSSNPSQEIPALGKSILRELNSIGHAKQTEVKESFKVQNEDTASVASTNALSRGGKANRRRDKRKDANRREPVRQGLQQNFAGEFGGGMDQDIAPGGGASDWKGSAEVGVQCNFEETNWKDKYAKLLIEHEDAKDLLLSARTELAAVKKIAGLEDSEEDDGYSIESETSLLLKGAFDEDNESDDDLRENLNEGNLN